MKDLKILHCVQGDRGIVTRRLLRREFKMRNLATTVYFIIHYPSSIIHYPLSIIHYPLSIIHYPSSIIHHPLSIPTYFPRADVLRT
ncbi:MAG: hypothetical protein FWG98_04145 [Candidatus Cloacimonetes bacterium]|nr:hypothetical protein [Candidatus Cloacimonadota bacterium]